MDVRHLEGQGSRQRIAVLMDGQLPKLGKKKFLRNNISAKTKICIRVNTIIFKLFDKPFTNLVSKSKAKGED